MLPDFQLPANCDADIKGCSTSATWKSHTADLAFIVVETNFLLAEIWNPSTIFIFVLATRLGHGAFVDLPWENIRWRHGFFRS